MNTKVSETVSSLDQAAIAPLIKDRLYVLIAPHSRDRNATMAYFLRPEFQSFYYAATAEDTDPAVYAAHLTDSPDAQLKRLGKDIASSGARFVILDEVDRLEQTASRDVIVALRAALPKTITIILNGRELDYRQWQPLIETGQAVFIDDANQAPPSAQVAVYGFGGGAVYANGLPITVWDGPLPRNLFYYFTDHPLITREEVFGTFWPGLPTKEATNVFHVTKRKVTERVGYETMIYSSGFYRASPTVDLFYDVSHFEAAIEQGRRNPEHIDHWTSAIALYRQPFLHRIMMPWVIERRQQLAQSYTEALIELARYHRKNDPAQAISFYLRALREMPHREDVHRDLMTMYAEQGQADKLHTQYRMLETELKRKFNIAPGKPTRELYTTLTNQSAKRR